MYEYSHKHIELKLEEEQNKVQIKELLALFSSKFRKVRASLIDKTAVAFGLTEGF